MSKKIYNILTVFLLLLLSDMEAMAGSNPWIDGYTDKKLEEAMVESYGSQAAVELASLEAYKKIAKEYGYSNLATAAIIAQKYMEHKHGFRDVGILGNSEENYYYKHIYKTVTQGIIPETYRCAYLLAKNPQGILYWGPFMLQICNETLELCSQFQTVVTNGKLGFDNVCFPVLNPKLAKFADLKEIGKRYGSDLKGMIDNLATFDAKSTSDSLVNFGLNNLKEIGVSIAAAGIDYAADRAGFSTDLNGLLGDSKICEAFKLKPQQVRLAYNTFTRVLNDRLYDPTTLKNTVWNIITTNGKIAVDKVLTSAVYNAESYLSDYLKELQGQYFRQHVRIIIRNAGSEVVCNYDPEMGKISVHNGDGKNVIEGVWPDSEYGQKCIASWSDDWLCYIDPYGSGKGTKHVSNGTTGGLTKSYIPKHRDLISSELNDVRRNAENHCGWSQSKVNSLNNNDKGYKYTYTETLKHGELHFDAKKHNWFHQLRCYFTYSIYVVKKWSTDQVYWEKDFDSQTMDYDAFQQEIKQRKAAAEFDVASKYGSDNSNYKVVVEQGERRYYQVPTNTSVKGANMVSFILNCDNHSDMGTSAMTWKENSHVKGQSMEQKKHYAERTSQSSDSENPVNEVQAKIDSLKADISSIEAQIAALEKKKNATNAVEIGKQIGDLERRKENSEALLDQANDALNEAKSDIADGNDVHRLPWLMNQVASRYHLTWQGDGMWNGLTYIRKGNVSGLSGTVTFEAEFSQTRGESYFLGIRIHRAIFKLDWRVYGDQSSSNIVETLRLDDSMTEEQKKKQVADKQQEIMNNYPDCSVEVSYGKADSTQTINDSKSFHLLWVSDRLALARDINAKLQVIYSDLVLLHRFLYSKETIKDFLKREIYLQVNQSLRNTIANSCLDDWMKNSKKITQSIIHPFNPQYFDGDLEPSYRDGYKNGGVYKGTKEGQIKEKNL